MADPDVPRKAAPLHDVGGGLALSGVLEPTSQTRRAFSLCIPAAPLPRLPLSACRPAARSPRLDALDAAA